MMTRRTKYTVLAGLLAMVFSQAALGGIHVIKSSVQSGTWYINDGTGQRWDINTLTGIVNDGNGDAYDGAMTMTVNGKKFSVSRRKLASLDSMGREIEIGPWTNRGVKVYRRIYVSPTDGYCRWIDIFENPSSRDVTVNVSYKTIVGGTFESVRTGLGKKQITAQDWGFLTIRTRQDYRPRIVYFFAARNATVRPNVTIGGKKNITCNYTLRIPARKAYALCTFQSQERNSAKAMTLLKAFRPARVLRGIPLSLRAIIRNMDGLLLSLGTLDLMRHQKHDIVVLRNGTQMIGKLGTEDYVLDTLWGKLTVPAAKVVGYQSLVGCGDWVKLGLVDGQVVAGRIDKTQRSFTLVNGNKLKLTSDRLDTAAYRLTPEKPDVTAIENAMIELRTGERLFFDLGDGGMDWEFISRYGSSKLNLADLNGIVLHDTDGGLHRAMFTNGSIIGGLLVADKLDLKLSLGFGGKVDRHMVMSIRNPDSDGDNEGIVTARPGVSASSRRATSSSAAMSEIIMNNGDILRGRLTHCKLILHTELGDITVDTRRIVQLAAIEGDTRRVEVKLSDGSTLRGTVRTSEFKFQITPGPTLSVPVGYISSYTGCGVVKALKPGGSIKPLRPKRLKATTRPQAVRGRRVVPMAARCEVVRSRSVGQGPQSCQGQKSRKSRHHGRKVM